MWESIKNIFKAILCLWIAWGFITSPGEVSNLFIQFLGVLFIFASIDYFFALITPIMDSKLAELKKRRRELEIIERLTEKRYISGVDDYPLTPEECSKNMKNEIQKD